MTHTCTEGLEALDRALERNVADGRDPIVLATRCAAHTRDALIALHRAGDIKAGGLLREMNALISELIAGEFPLVGVRRDRIKEARDTYRRLAGEIERLLQASAAGSAQSERSAP